MKTLPGINVYALLTVDLLHEVELGVWKSLYIHILRIIQTTSREGHNTLDRRCVCVQDRIQRLPNTIGHSRLRCVPKFGKDTIREFTSNASHMRKIAAHDFEDILQVWSLLQSSNTPDTVYSAFYLP
jgi:hypothetical protein